jgi:hypothetical protein
MIRRILERALVRRAFRRYSSATRQALAGEQESPFPGELHTADIGYALVMLRADTPAELSRRMGRAAELAEAHRAFCNVLVSGLVVLSIGTLPQLGAGDQAQLIAALVLEFGADVKIVHGAAAGQYGTLGGPGRFSYGFILPVFDEALGRLSALPFGDTEEFPPGPIEGEPQPG